MTPDKSVILVLGGEAEDLPVLARGASGHTVLGVPGPEALPTLIAEHSPDLLVLDLTQATSLLERPDAPRAALLLVVAPGEQAAAEALLERGAGDVLVRPFSPEAARARMANVIARHRYHALLRRIVSVDPLTGLANRRRFDHALDLEWRRALRGQSPLAIVLVELDHFRTFPGRYGRSAADACLLQVADALESCLLRAGDLVARIDDGRFGCVLPETDRIGAVAVAERMRAEVAALAIPHAGSRTAPTLTASLGVATCTPPHDEGHEELLAEAEHRLTQAKGRGRNQVVFGQGTP